MGNIDDHIKNTFDGEEIPFNPEHWEQLKARLNQADKPTPFEERAKNVFDNASVPMAAGAWDQFSQKLNEAQSTPFEKAVKDKFSEAKVPYNESHWENISNKINPGSGFDQKIRAIFNAEKVPYNVKHWEQMENMLNGSGKKVGGLFNWKNVAASAALVLLGWLTYAALNSSKENTTAVNSSVPEKQYKTDSKLSLQKETSSLSVMSSEQKNNNSKVSSALEKKNTSFPNEPSNTNHITSTEKHSIKSKNNTITAYTNSSSTPKILPEKNKAIENQENIISQKSTKSIIQFREIAMADKAIISENEEGFDTLATQTLESDWSGMIFKYATLPSSLPTSILTNIWDHPAIAGVDQHTAVKFLYNSPWENKVVDRETGNKEFHLIEPANMYLSVDGNVGKNHKLGVGGYYQRIINNNWESDNVNLTVSYTHSIDKFTQIRGGVGVTYSNNALNTENINFWEQKNESAFLVANDEAVNIPERYLNYKAGFWLNHPLVFGGITFDNLSQTTITKKPDLQLTSSTIAGVNIPVTKKFTTTAYFKRISNIKASYSVGTMLSYNNKIFAGVSYENSNYATVRVGCNIKNQLRLHMSCGIMANKESLYINDTNEGFVTAGIRYLIEPSKKSSNLPL